MVVLNECVELQEPSNLVTRDDSQVSMHLQQHHFGGAGSVPSPTTTLNHHMVGSLGRKINNNGSTVGRSHRLSSFRPLHGQHADLIRECIEERMTAGPTYETIDPHHLSHFGYSTDYCTVSGSGCSSGSSIGRNNAGCIETILPDARCYATAGRGHTGRATDYQPVNPHHNPIYCSNTKQLDKSDGFGVLSAIFAIISLMSYVIDIGTDLSVCYFLYGINDRFSLGLTFAITIIPSITVNIFSIKW
ncbi:unnamed protein product [Medioppia subpectinata]|uniref:XK-related protein n=1 Tax=Medioppia subpectinata TaxID=1979941 RepID=A0A7R9KBU6_9ACAR|nr:unnamed protein product [Medioppia subpectinata]CAG2100230.1 unnamed protein product [Medioppia subpectinata]